MLGEGQRVRVHFLVHAADGLPEVAIRDARAPRSSQLARTWDDDARRRARRAPRRGRGARCCGRSGRRACPSTTRATRRRELAAIDVALLRAARPRTGRSSSRLQPLARAHTRVALYERGAEDRARRRAADARGPRAAGDRGDLHAAARRRGDVGAGVPRARARTGSRSTSTRRRAAWPSCSPPSTAATRSPTTLNRLVITAGLDRRQVAILRAYRKYRQRVGSRFTESYQNDVLAANSRDHRQARALLRAALRPRRSRPTRPPRARCATRSWPTSTRSPRSTTTASCATSSAAIDATLRTNAYNADREALAFKLRSADVPAMPQPRAVRRDLRLRARRRGHPPARRADRARRPPLVRPPWTTAPRSTG